MLLLALLLALALFGLWIANRGLARRIDRIERRLAALEPNEGRPGAGRENGGVAAPIVAEPGSGATAAPRDAAPAPARAEGETERETPGALFERLVAGRLLIWAGGVALVVAAAFLIRYSIEIGLITPAARMIAAALFGLALIGAGEAARARPAIAGDPRVAQALVGAGIAVLFGAAYGSHILYGLIGAGAGAAAMTAITLAALGLSLRHGAPAAAIGLVGGFATPLMLGEAKTEALALLAGFALLDAAAFALAWRRGWAWLAVLAMLLSFAWTGWFILGARADALAAGVFAVALATLAAAAWRRDDGGAHLPALIGAAELAALAARSDVGPWGWGLYGLVSAALLALAFVRPGARAAPAGALALALLVLAGKAAFGPLPFTPEAAIGTTLLFGAGGAALSARARTAGLLAAAGALAGPLLVLRLGQPELLGRTAWGVLATVLALAALALTRIGGRGAAAAGAKGALALAAGVTALLLAVAAADFASGHIVSLAWLIVAAALLIGGRRFGDRPLRLAGLALLTVTACKVFLIDAARLEGLWRIASFLGLGIALIGIGRLYGPVLRAERPDAA
jgi:uncharacterized membrane protein